MAAHRRTRFDDRGLVVREPDGRERPLPVLAGALHYWRVEPRRWAGRLAQLHALGLTLVETPVPWRVHEPAPGAREWFGARDLGRFLEAARAAGLAVMLQLGPRVDAELTSGGLPDHVVAEPAVQARTARGTPAWLPLPPRAWPLPSYAAAAFHARVRAWYAQVAEVIGPHLAPAGPVVALGVDHGDPRAFRLGAFDLDYHPDAIAWWREDTGDAGEPPRAWDPAAPGRAAAWVRSQERYAARALGALSRLLDEAGLDGVARFHALSPGHLGPRAVRSIQAAIGGPVGLPAATARADFPALRRRAIAVAGAAEPAGLPPLALDVGVGGAPWIPPPGGGGDASRERDQLLTLLAGGARGIHLAMAVERERHHGAAISAAGDAAPHAAWLRPLLAALAEVSWPALRRRPAVALVEARADARYGLATQLVDPMTPALTELLRLGPGGAAELGADPGAIAARRWHDALVAALELAQVPYAIVDEEASEDELAAYRAVIAPTQGRVDRALWGHLRALAEARRAILVIGPELPTLDELGRPLELPPPRRAGRLKPGSLDDLPGLAADLSSLIELPDAWQIERPDDVRAFAHADPAGEVRVVFVTSAAPRAATASLLAGEGARALRDPLTAERFAVAGGRASIPLPPRGVRLLIVEP